MRKSSDPLDQLGIANSLLIGLVCAAAIEIVTCIFRFGFGMQSTRDTSWVAAVTFGFRVHHGYLGVLCIIIATVFFPTTSGYRYLGLIVGFGLAFSDLFHHFAILWPLTGDPQFDIRYP